VYVANARHIGVVIREAVETDATRWLQLLPVVAAERTGIGHEPEFDPDERIEHFLEGPVNRQSLSLENELVQFGLNGPPL